MAKTKNFELMEKVKELHAKGMSDGKIAIEMGTSLSNIHYYRYNVLRLKANQEKKNYHGNDVAKLKGYIIRGIKSSAKRRGIEFNIKSEDLNLNEQCPLLEVNLNYKNFLGRTDSNSDVHATVDRIDNSKGYVKGNVWIISRLANNMKNKANPEQLKTFSKNILAKNMI